MSAVRRKEATVRQAELVSAAASLFAERGVAATAVSDIVKAAGVAQGTFYLYFPSKEAIVCAVAETLIADVAQRMEQALAVPGRTAVERLDALAAALLDVSDEPYEIELMQAFHNPSNESLHDRVSRSMNERFLPALAAIVAQGVQEGAFHSEDAAMSARFVLGALQGIGPALSDSEQGQDAIAQLRSFVLRGLGYKGT